MSRERRISLQGAVLLVLIAAAGLNILAIAWLEYAKLHAVILQGFDRKLAAASTVVASFIDPAAHELLLHPPDGAGPEAVEAGPTYQAYVRPMREILADQGLTYLYTFVLTGGQRIVYVLDATEGEDHSVPGTVDEDPADEVMQEVWHRGEVRASPVQDWQQWGLIKSGFAPIFDANQQVLAVAGADVNISTIDHQTRAALLRVTLAGAVLLLAGSLVVLRIARHLAGQLRELQNTALRVAAGSYGDVVAVKGPRELRELGGAFSLMSRQVASSIGELERTHRLLMERRREQELCRRLAEDVDRETLPQSGPLAVVRLGDGRTTADASGWALGGGRALVWEAAAQPSEPLPSLVLRHRLGLLLRAPLARHGGNWDTLRPAFAALGRDSVAWFALLEGASEASPAGARFLARRSAPALLVGRAGARVLDLDGRDQVILDPGQMLVLLATGDGQKLAPAALGALGKSVLDAGCQTAADVARELEKLLGEAGIRSGTLVVMGRLGDSASPARGD